MIDTNQKIQGFPSPFASKQIKDSSDYGLQFAKAIDKISRNSYFVERNKRFKLNSAFARGEQNAEPYLDTMNIDGKRPFISLDYTNSPIMIKMLNTITSKFMNTEEVITARTIDINSVKSREHEVKSARYRMKHKNSIKELENAGGISFEDPNSFTPDSPAELEIWEQTSLKTREEIILEKAIELIQNDNYSEEVKRMVIYNLCVKGVAATKSYTDGAGRIRYRDVDLSNLVHSYSGRSDFSDLWWASEYIPIKISEIRQRWNLSEKELFNLATSVRGKHGNPGDYITDTVDPHGMRQYDDFSVMVSNYTFTTSIEKTYVVKTKSGGKQFVDRSEGKINETDSKKNLSSYDRVCYEGYWVAGTSIILEHGLMKNMLKPNSNPKEVVFPYVIYMPDNIDMKNKSLVEMAVPIIRQLDVTYLKIQQVIAKARPAGYSVDITAMEDVDLGLGGKMTPLELLEIADQTGNIFYRSVSTDEDRRVNIPINATVSDISGNINALIRTWEFHFQRLREYIGVNEYTDSSSINPRVGARVVESQVKASNNAIAHIYAAYQNIIERTCGLCAMRFWDQICFGNPDYLDFIGGDNAQFITENKDSLSTIDFNIKFEVGSSEEERQILESDIQVSLANQLIELKDAREIRKIKNYKLGNLYLEVAKEKKRKADMADATSKSKENANAQAEAGKAVAQAKMEADKIKIEAGVATEKAKGEAQLIKTKTEFIQKILTDSFEKGADVPVFLQGIVAKYLDNLLNSQSQPTEQPKQTPQGQPEPQDEDHSGELSESQDGDLIVRDGEVISQPKAGEVEYASSPTGGEVTEQGDVVIPADAAHHYLSLGKEERIALEQQIVGEA
jgi:hypothetical protein